MKLMVQQTKRLGQFVALAGALMSSQAAMSTVLFEEDFTNGFGEFSDEGRAYASGGEVLLRGGSSAGSIYKLDLNTKAYENLTLSYDRSTSGLDSGESLDVLVSIDGLPYEVIASESGVNGTVSLPIEKTNLISLQFVLNASSYFETATIDNVRIEGNLSCEPDCMGDGDHGDGESREVVIITDPTWQCNELGAIPDIRRNEALFSTQLPINQTINVGQTPMGDRTVISTLAGNASGLIYGEILSGALDFELALPSGAKEYESRYTFEASDGTLIYMRNCGVADGNAIRFVADFEAPNNSDYAWLNTEEFVGIRKVVNGNIELSVYIASGVTSGAHYAFVPSDNDLVQQSWDCPAIDPTLQQGREILSARVGIGGFQTIGDSKNGERRIIPITGGTFSGDISGDVNAGGADFQLTVNDELSLEARYTLETQDGEYIVVRNCGDYATGDLTSPQFEANVNGNYNWLNEGTFVGTISPLFTRVIIDIFEAN